jgi:hypothetical protein
MDDNAYHDFIAWLDRLNRSDPPPDRLAAYNIRLFESQVGYMAYLIGSRVYDLDDEDWACNEDYVPIEKYFRLPKDLAAGKDWRDVQRQVRHLLKRYLESSESKGSFLATGVVTVGFDDGNLERVA